MASKKISKRDVIWVLDTLKTTYPEAKCALDHINRWQLLVAVVLSAQTTDVSVNKITPLLFENYPDPSSLATAKQEDIEKIIKTIGMYRTKSKNIIALAKQVLQEHEGEVPGNFDDLIKLRGVGRKTANVVLAVGFGEQRIAVDTHVFRVSNRIGLCSEKDVLSTELALQKVIPKDRWSESHHSLIWHGRRICHARKPDCENCPVNEKCMFTKWKNMV